MAVAAAASAQPVSGQLLVKFRDRSGGPRLLSRSLIPTGARVLEALPLPGWHRVELPPEMDLRAGIRWFKTHRDVALVEPNHRYSLHAASNDPELPRLFGLERIGATTGAWARQTGRSNIVVAVLDTGIDPVHPDLAPNLWRNTREIPDNRHDDDGNGWVDDVLGIDVVEGDGDPADDSGHGTHVAGTIGAVGNNGRGISGVCWEVRLMAVRVASVDDFATTAGLVNAFSYVAEMRARGEDIRVINCSWGGGFPSAALREAVGMAGAAGILIICSAGNEHQDNDLFPTYPAGYDCPQILSVAASTACDDPASFSNFGRTTVHLAAPGSGILSTYRGGDRYALFSGTSMSSPHVSGAAALIASGRPELTAGDLRALLLSSVDVLPSWAGKVVSGGRLNLARALELAETGTIPPAPRAAESSRRLTAISRAPSGEWGNGDSTEPAISADGRWVAFASHATNLVAGDSEGFQDIFLHDRLLRVTTRVSQTPDGRGAMADSSNPVLSADGRLVAFVSSAPNLVEGDMNDASDVFVWERETGRIETASANADGRAGNGPSEAPAINADGSVIAFASEATDLVVPDENNNRDVFIRDRVLGRTTRVSIAPDGLEAQGWSDAPSLDGTGRIVAFHSDAANLVRADTNEVWDVFVHDLNSGLTELASVGDAGLQADADSGLPALSADGRYLIYHSAADNLDGRPPDPFLAVFLRDRPNHQVLRLSDRPGGGSGGDAFVDALSADGRFATFTSDDPGLAPGGAPGFFRTYIVDRLAGTLGPVALNDGAYGPDDTAFLARPSANGQLIAFASHGFNLMPGDANGVADIFVLDRGTARPDLGVRPETAPHWAGLGILHTQAPQRAQLPLEPGTSARFIARLLNGGDPGDFLLQLSVPVDPGWSVRAFEPGGAEITSELLSGAWRSPRLAEAAHLDLRIEVTRGRGLEGEAAFEVRLMARAEPGAAPLDAVSCIATIVLPPPHLRLVSRGWDGAPAGRNAEVLTVSAGGTSAAFSSDADHLDARGDENGFSDVFLVDRSAGTIRRISDPSPTAQGNGESRYPSLDAAGQRIAFQSRASNLVPFDSNGVEDIFVRDLVTGAIGRISVSESGTAGNRGSESAFISAGGRFVAFTSSADNLVASDTNSARDIFVRDLETGVLECASRSGAGTPGNGDSESAFLTPDGRFVLFQSHADNLGRSDTNGFLDVYLWDRATQSMELISRNTNGVAGNGPSGGGSISSDGRWIAFYSYASDLAPGAPHAESQAYLLDRHAQSLHALADIVPTLPGGRQARRAIISPNGVRLAIAATPPCGDANPASQVFVLDRLRGTLDLVSATRSGSPGENHSFAGQFSPDSRFLTLESYAPNLVGESSRPAAQVHLADLARPEVDAFVQRETGSPWRGEQSKDLSHQTVSAVLLRSDAGATHGFAMRLCNAGTDPDHLILRARTQGVAEVTIATRDGLLTNVTAEVFNGGWRSPPLAGGAEVELLVTVAFGGPPARDVQIDLQLASSINPWEQDAVRLVAMADSDRDGLPDTWERVHFGTLAGSPSRDTDQDGLSDLEEWRSGTHPLDAGSGLRMIGILKATSGSLEILWPATAERFYSIERRPEWGAAFVPLSPAPLAGTNGLMRWTDPAASEGSGFYRVAVELP
jgi:Tol biopolymer transport system component